MSEINPGVWDGLSPELAREKYPDEWDRFLKDPYSHRAPRAESYHDLSGGFPAYPHSSLSFSQLNIYTLSFSPSRAVHH